MKTIIKNLEEQITELNKQDEILSNQGNGWFTIERENIRACMSDIKNVIKTLKNH